MKKRYLDASDNKLLCDRCAKVIYASQALVEWNDLIVCRHCYHEREEADYYILPSDEQLVPNLVRAQRGLPTEGSTNEWTNPAIAGLAVAGVSIAGHDFTYYTG